MTKPALLMAAVIAVSGLRQNVTSYGWPPQRFRQVGIEDAGSVAEAVGGQADHLRAYVILAGS
jgi:hypothetical protein